MGTGLGDPVASFSGVFILFPRLNPGLVGLSLTPASCQLPGSPDLIPALFSTSKGLPSVFCVAGFCGKHDGICNDLLSGIFSYKDSHHPGSHWNGLKTWGLSTHVCLHAEHSGIRLVPLTGTSRPARTGKRTNKKC